MSHFTIHDVPPPLAGGRGGGDARLDLVADAARPGLAWVGVGLGLLAGAAAWTGGPLLTAGLALAGTAVDLLANGAPASAILGP